MIWIVTADRTKRIARARAQYDRAYAALVQAIREDVDAKVVTVTEASKQSGWSRQYIGEIRAGEAGNTPPKHRNRPAGARPVRHAAPA